MKRYEHYGTLDGGGPAEAVEEADGTWVRYDDALAAVAAERERWEAVVFDGWRVLKGLDEAAAKRTMHQNVSDTLDALMRVLRA